MQSVAVVPVVPPPVVVFHYRSSAAAAAPFKVRRTDAAFGIREGADPPVPRHSRSSGESDGRAAGRRLVADDEVASRRPARASVAASRRRPADVRSDQAGRRRGAEDDPVPWDVRGLPLDGRARARATSRRWRRPTAFGPRSSIRRSGWSGGRLSAWTKGSFSSWQSNSLSLSHLISCILMLLPNAYVQPV